MKLSFAISKGSLGEKVPRVNFYAVPLSLLDVGLLPLLLLLLAHLLPLLLHFLPLLLLLLNIPSSLRLQDTTRPASPFLSQQFHFSKYFFLFFQSRLSIQQLKRTPLASVLNLANMKWNVEAHLIWIPEEKYGVPGNRAVPQVGWRDLLLRARRASTRDRAELFCTSPTSPTHYFPSLLFYTFLLYSVQKSFAYFKYSTDFSHLSILHISCLEPILLSTYRLMY